MNRETIDGLLITGAVFACVVLSGVMFGVAAAVIVTVLIVAGMAWAYVQRVRRRHVWRQRHGMDDPR